MSETKPDSKVEEEFKKIYDYDYNDVHKDLEQGKYAGAYGWDHACYWAIAEKKANVDLLSFYSRRTKDETYVQSIKDLLENPETQKSWNRIVTFDPYGMTATIPTCAGTTATLNIPELSEVRRDGIIVNDDASINVTKAAVYYSWNLPSLSKRLEIPEDEFREVLYKYTHDERLKDPNIKVFLPPIGGFTAYMFGDIRKIRDPKTEIAVRVHDECNGSDVFGSDICTCRPYLMFALQACVECAQRGGVGICVYFRKEGRSLGEVIKYRVYNARKNQEGGDSAQKYFYQTENIAGIRDARMQTMMPDVLNWFGIRRIDLLLSMSSDKYDAIISQGVVVSQRVPLPNVYVPKNAFVELTAKIFAGYHADDIKDEEVIGEIRDLRSIRKQCQRIYDLSQKNELYYWKLNLDKLDNTVNIVHDCILKNYPDLNIPPHSRFRHFNNNKLSTLINKWKEYTNQEEITRRLIDLITISVLLDAGAGEQWSYIDSDGKKTSRSEGLAAASFDMFCDGLFSSDPALKTRVNSLGLKKLTVHQLQVGFQVSANNPMVGLEGRCALIQRLGRALHKNPQYFGYEIQRPGNLLDYILKYTKDKRVSVHILWQAIIEGLENIWPQRLSGVRRGDVWSHNGLRIIGKPGSDLVPFHKLQQWLVYSIIEALQLYGLEIYDLEAMTGLAEYRNGGLFIDTGVLEFKDKSDSERYFDAGSELVVEWRALTIILIDHLCERLRKKLNKTKEELSLAKVLEGGTWRAGRELAYQLRNGNPPLKIRSDGTVF